LSAGCWERESAKSFRLSPCGLGLSIARIHPGRIAENIDVFDFTLTADDVAAIDAMDTGKRGGPDPEVVNAKTFSFRLDD
jgi:hypothetical protein